jgi:chromosome partitioning protein
MSIGGDDFLKTFSFINKKGGVGKTTIVDNAAYVLAERYGARVLVIDNDDQGNDSQFFGVSAEKNIADVISQKASLAQVIQHTRYPLIDVVPADMDLASTNVDMIRANISDNLILKKALQEVSEQYDICLIDNPPRIDSITVANSLIASDEIIVVCIPDIFSVNGVRQMVSLIESAKNFNPNLVFRGAVLNMFTSDTESFNMMHQLAEICPLFDTHIRKTDNYKVRVRSASAKQLAVYEYSPNCAFARDMIHFVDELVLGE